MVTLLASGSTPTIPVREPSHNDVFYGTSNSAYKGDWYCGAAGTKVASVPPISQILAARPTVRRPVRPLVATAKTVLADAIRDERQQNLADKVLSADVVPKKFPVEAKNMAYPASGRAGADNPLYATSSAAHGKEVPMKHQIPDRYFPSTNNFTKGFVDTKPRHTGLTTAASPSKVHSALNEYY